ncbi:hypothetical protein MARA_01030 (plasmid) [Mycolicibacterium arabiense]|uniref:Condensation domain-containing protein n=1 Tax=Mycolicibacterium arabiense TaxID=1286181 RepID=A0A7I7RQ57_9MYCO|nr:condensation domain-containing protein [Mycolicibacterium arabiense]MCV7372006.1 hypothetical protein [Mycolicibacterium arabiense]BBY46673.1 hypothetical protein MARA_01030 [Mycolicibacterium arabiense]
MTLPEQRVIRPLGALERLFYRYSEAHPVHFTLAAEFAFEIPAEQLRHALAKVAQRHALLQVRVGEASQDGPIFLHDSQVVGLPLSVSDADPREWPFVAAEELAAPFDRQTAPLARAILLRRRRHSVVLLTLDHTVADGISAALVLRDLILALNGIGLNTLPPPPSQESMLARHCAAVDSGYDDAAESPAQDARMNRVSSVRPFDGVTPHVATASLTENATAQLVSRARAQRSTVHSALVSATARVRRQISRRLHTCSVADQLPVLDRRARELRRLLHVDADRGGC